MVTLSLVAIGAILAVFLIYVVMRSGDRSGRHDQSSREAVNKQQSERQRVEKTRAVDGRD